MEKKLYKVVFYDKDGNVYQTGSIEDECTASNGYSETLQETIDNTMELMKDKYVRYEIIEL